MPRKGRLTLSYILFCLALSVVNTKSAQSPCANSINCCSNQCDEDLSCICQCLFDMGKALRLNEDYTRAYDYFKAGQNVQLASGVCGNLNFQLLMDSIFDEYRIWIKEPGSGNKFAIANMRGKLVEKEKPYNPYRFSNPQPFKRGVAIYSENEKYFFVTIDGQVLTPKEGYDGIIQMEQGAFYLIKENQGHFENSITSSIGIHPVLWLSNHKKTPLIKKEFGPWKDIQAVKRFAKATNNKFDSVKPFQEGVAWTNKNGLWGLIDHSGQEILPPLLNYDSVNDFSEGLATIWQEGRQRFINTKGKEVNILKDEYFLVGNFHSGLAMVEKDGKRGSINKKGEELIPLIYDNVDHFKNGYARVNKGDFWGIIDTNNNEILPIQYEIIDRYDDGSTLFLKDGAQLYFDFAGNNKKRDTSQDSKEAPIILKVFEKGKWGLGDSKGNNITPIIYDEIGALEQGLLLAQKDNISTFLDTSGNEIPLCQRTIGSLSIEQKGITFFDENKREIDSYRVAYEAKINYGFLRSFDSLLYENGKKKDSLYARTDTDDLILPASKDEQNQSIETSKGLTETVSGDFHGFVDEEGYEVVPCVLSSSHPVSQDIFMLYRSGKKGLLFANEKTYIPCEYEEIAQIHDEWVMVRRDSKWGWVDHRGNIKIPCRYDAATPFDESGKATVFQFGLQFKINMDGEMVWK